jgi:osmotically-inducible protein OsmY
LHSQLGTSTRELAVATSLTTRIERALEQADLHLAVEEGRDRITISGLVDSPEAREAVLEIAGPLTGSKAIDLDVEISLTLPREGADIAIPPAGNLADTIVEIDDANRQLAPDLAEMSPGSTDALSVIEDGEEPYFPPTDPVIAPSSSERLEVLGGWTATAADDVEVAPSAGDDRPGDDALADAIRRELREDAATTALELRVTVRGGRALLRGLVPDLVDAENAEAVAARVPGVVEVVEELDVQSA